MKKKPKVVIGSLMSKSDNVVLDDTDLEETLLSQGYIINYTLSPTEGISCWICHSDWISSSPGSQLLSLPSGRGTTKEEALAEAYSGLGVSD